MSYSLGCEGILILVDRAMGKLQMHRYETDPSESPEYCPSLHPLNPDRCPLSAAIAYVASGLGAASKIKSDGTDAATAEVRFFLSNHQ